MKKKNVKNINEEVLLTNFEELSKTKKVSSLWFYFSMLRSNERSNKNDVKLALEIGT